MAKSNRIAKRETAYNLVRLHNHLVFSSSYYLSPVATKVLYYMIAKRFDPDRVVGSLSQEEFYPLKELSRAIVETEKEVEVDALTKKSSNSLYDTIKGIIEELSQLQFVFSSELFIDGKPLPNIVNVFNSVGGGKGKNGEKGIKTKINSDVDMLLYQLQRYVLVYRTEINKLSSGYTIRFYQMLRGILNKKKKFGLLYCTETLPLEEVHFLLNTTDLDTYQEFKHFNNLLLKKIARDINKHTSIHLEINAVRTIPKVKVKEGEKRKRGRKKTTHIELKFHDENWVKNAKKGVNNKEYVPNETELSELTFAEMKAYKLLVDFKVKPGIAFRQIIPSIEGSESVGFEDFFIQSTMDYFTKNSKNQKTEEMKVSTYVNWWTKHKYFRIENDVWSKMNEEVTEKKKTLRIENPRGFVNRTIAKDMTAEQFRNEYWEKDLVKPKSSNKNASNNSTPSDGFTTIKPSIDKYLQN